MRGRIFRFCGAVLGACALAAPAVLAAEDEVVLAPIEPWVVNFDTDSCALYRQFGDPEEPVFLELRQFAPRSGFSAAILTSAYDLRRTRLFEVAFMPDAEPTEVYGTQLEGDGGLDGYMFLTDLKPASRRAYEEESTDFLTYDEWSPEQDLERAREVTGIRIAGAFRTDLVLDTGSLGDPIEVMQTCIDELLTHWGIDVEAHRDLQRPVVPRNRQSWVRSIQQSYPRDGLRRGEQAHVRVRLAISEEGLPTDCSVQTRINSETFNKTACEELMDHARFDPAIDAEGNPIASFYVTAVVYRFR